MSLVRTHCGVGSNYNNAKYKDSSNSTGSKTSILQNSAWIGQTVYCKAEVKDTANNVASIKSDSVRLSSALVTTPRISSLNKTTFQATNNTQDLRIYGSNFTSSSVVYIDFGNGYQAQSSSYTNYRSSGEIRFQLRTTTSGSGTWKVKVRNGSTYSNYKSFNIQAVVQNPSISSLNKTTFQATNNTQDLRIYGSNFTSSSVVYIDFGNGYQAQSSSYTNYRSSGEIRFQLRTTTSGSGTWKVKVKNGSTYSNDKSFNIQAVVQNPSISSLNKTTFQATNNTQDLRIYGSNFTSSSVVYIDFGNGYQAQSSSYTNYRSSGEIRFQLRTTTSGSGTWKVKVKNGSTYSNDKSFNIQAVVQNPSISSLNKTTFQATNNTQDLRIYGSNFTSSSVVYIDFGNGYQAQSSSYTNYRSSGEIRFQLRTTTSGSGTWKVKVRNGSTYSNYKSFSVRN